MHHIVYKTTCTMTGRYYIGLHSTSDIDDGYLGSGLLIRRSLKKHGPSAHVREILGRYDSREQASEREKKLVTWELLAGDKWCMNKAPGGEGGDLLSQHPRKAEIFANNARVGEDNGMYGKNHSASSKKLMSINRSGATAWNAGSPRTDDELKKISIGTRAGMREPEAWLRFITAIKKAALENTGKITIWKNGRKKIVWPSIYTAELIQAGWVRSKAASITSGVDSSVPCESPAARKDEQAT